MIRHAVIHGAHYLAVIVVCLAAITPLSRASWPRVKPGLGIAVWQALLLSITSSLVGLAWSFGLAPYRAGELAALGRMLADLPAGRVPLSPVQGAAVTAGALVAAAHLSITAHFVWATIRRRERHRHLLALVGTPGDAAGVTVIDHPAVAAYCLPGWRPDIVVTSGAVHALSAAQLDAVLAHERAHAAERHHFVVLPFVALRRAFRRFRLAERLAERMATSVELLVEMRADDRAAATADRRHLRDALTRFALTPGLTPPPGTLGAAGAVTQRLHRLNEPPRPLTRTAVASVVIVALFVATTPPSLLALP
jgi:Zn-dependent protease with chaperone function